MSEVTPAVIRKVPVWTEFHARKVYAAPQGSVQFRFSAVIGSGKSEFLEVDDMAISIVNTGNFTHPTYSHEKLSDAFGEIVTRADGSTATLLDLLDEVLTKLAKQDQSAMQPQP